MCRRCDRRLHTTPLYPVPCTLHLRDAYALYPALCTLYPRSPPLRWHGSRRHRRRRSSRRALDPGPWTLTAAPSISRRQIEIGRQMGGRRSCSGPGPWALDLGCRPRARSWSWHSSCCSPPSCSLQPVPCSCCSPPSCRLSSRPSSRRPRSLHPVPRTRRQPRRHQPSRRPSAVHGYTVQAAHGYAVRAPRGPAALLRRRGSGRSPKAQTPTSMRVGG